MSELVEPDQPAPLPDTLAPRIVFTVDAEKIPAAQKEGNDDDRSA